MVLLDRFDPFFGSTDVRTLLRGPTRAPQRCRRPLHVRRAGELAPE